MIVDSAETEKEIYLMIEMLFVTDYVCPYCLVEKVAIEQALEELGMEANITYQLMELTEEPKERVDTYSDPKRREGRSAHRSGTPGGFRSALQWPRSAGQNSCLHGRCRSLP